jgi:hypothetical protein
MPNNAAHFFNGLDADADLADNHRFVISAENSIRRDQAPAVLADIHDCVPL